MTRAGTTALAVSGSAVVAAIVLWRVVGAESAVPEAEPPAVQDELAVRLSELAARLDAEVEAREALELQVAELERALADPGPVEEADAEDDPEDERLAALRELAAGARAGPFRQFGRRGGFDVDELTAAGLSEADAHWLHERYDESQLALLNLRHLAQREGWASDGTLAQELQDENQALRQDLGENMYDWMLYGSGRPNRVRVRDVFEGSAGSEIGLQKDDLILSYNGRNVYSPADLRPLTAGVPLGKPVEITFERNDEPVQRQIAGGAIGASLGRTRKPPAVP